MLGAQNNIQSVSFLPSLPGPADSVKVLIDLRFNSGGCDLEYESHTVSNDTIEIHVSHCPGPLTVICYTTDTINIGPLAPGIYQTLVKVYTGSFIGPQPCADTIPVDSATVQIAVTAGTGISNPVSKAPVVFYNIAEKILVIEGLNSSEATLLLFNTQGEQVIRKKILQSEKVQLNDLSKGIYLYELRSLSGQSASGKLTVQ
jgi:hypothetical protein